MGLDTLAMEGFNNKIIDEEFLLREKGFASSIIVAVGYHREDNFNKSLSKSRLPKNEIIERVWFLNKVINFDIFLFFM